MEGRSSSRMQRLFIRIHSAENLRHVSSQGTYCRGTIGDGEIPSGSRSSLKRLLHHSTNSSNQHPENESARSHDPLSSAAASLPRFFKTQVQKATKSNAVWKEKFELPVYDHMTEVLSLRIKSARLMTAPSIGSCSIPLKDIPTETTSDQWINLFDTSKRPAGRIRIQLRLVHGSATLSRRGSEGRDENNSYNNSSARRSTTTPVPESPVFHHKPQHHPSPGNQTTTGGGGIGGLFRRSTPLANSLVEARTSSSTATTSESVSSDSSNSRLSSSWNNSSSFGPESSVVNRYYGRGSSNSPVLRVPPPAQAPAPAEVACVSPVAPPPPQPQRRESSRDTALSTASRGTTASEDLDLLASKYMTKQPPPPILAAFPELGIQRSTSTGSNKSSNSNNNNNQSDVKKERVRSTVSTGSPRTTNTTAVSSGDEEEMTVEFDFDTGDVRPSTRLPSQMMMRATWLSRSTVASLRMEPTTDETDDEEEEDDDEFEPDENELDPDGAPDGPRMFLRSTVTKLLRRDSVNVIMDAEEEDDDEDEFDEGGDTFAPFVFDELPILDYSKFLHFDDIDYTDRHDLASA